MRSVHLKMAASWYAAARSTRTSHSSFVTRSRTEADLTDLRLADMGLSVGVAIIPFDLFQRVQKERGIVLREQRRIGEHPPPDPGPWTAVVQAEHVAHDGAQRNAFLFLEDCVVMH